jgi:hypothetical protein
MASEKKSREIRVQFYTSQSVIRYITTNGIPKSKRAFREMVTSGASEKLDSEKGRELIDCLGRVVFFKHPQQINVMDKSNLKMIASIPR